MTVLAIKGSGVRIPSAPPIRSSVLPGQCLDQSSESYVQYGRLRRPSHLESLGAPRNGSRIHRADDEHLVWQRVDAGLGSSGERERGGRYLGIRGSGAVASASVCPWENPATGLTDVPAARGGTRELDEFLGASSAGDLPVRIKPVVAQSSGVPGLYGRIGA
jgi:hypothetical protein